MPNTRFINPPNIHPPRGYTHVVEATGPGRIVYIAGQLGADAAGKMAGDFRGQAVQAFETSGGRVKPTSKPVALTRLADHIAFNDS